METFEDVKKHGESTVIDIANRLVVRYAAKGKGIDAEEVRRVGLAEFWELAASCRDDVDLIDAVDEAEKRMQKFIEDDDLHSLRFEAGRKLRAGMWSGGRVNRPNPVRKVI